MPMSKWEKIETAPKDKTVVDIWHPELGRLVNMRRVYISRSNVFYEQTEGGYSCVRYATHWMPLPEPPQGTK